MESSRVDPFLPLIATLRTAAFILGTLLAAPRIVRGETDVLVAGGILVATTAWRILHPLHLTSADESDSEPAGKASDVWLLIDLGLTVIAVAASGRWESPYLLVLTANVVHMGLARGYIQALVIAATATTTVMTADLYVSSLGDVAGRSARSGMLLMLTAVAGGYARHLFLESEERHDVALERVVKLGEANRLLAAEEERVRIARELHDRVAQTLAFVSFELERVSMLDADKAKPELPRLRQEVQRALADMRETLSRLRTKVTDAESLIALARRQLALFEKRTGIQVSFSTNAESKHIDKHVEQEIWLILGEALANIECHSGATQAWVSWTLNGHTALLEVRDNGRGFDVAQTEREDAFGITGMHERSRSIGALLVINSMPDRGTSVTVELETP